MSKKKKEVKSKQKKKVHWMTWHGTLGNEKWALPKCVAKTDLSNRPDQKNLTNASEYLDDVKVLDAKMKIVAEMVVKSKMVIAYTGAGISRASGIADYGTKASNSVMANVQKLRNPSYAKPTYSHHVLANMEKKGLLKYYVQQNHDGLPQKAGFPQEKMNEIHGAWFDPSNPVVQFSQSLRGDLFKDMIQIEEATDLCLCLGTSLSGMNADRCVTTPCEKFAGGVTGCNGSVIVNLQFTPVDIPGYVPIRIWAKIDDAMKLLVKYLKLNIKTIKVPVEKDIIVCPYNAKGQFDETKRMVLNLSYGQKVQICQPGSSCFGEKGVVSTKDLDGHYRFTFPKRGRRLGKWWMNCIKNGKVRQLPLMNIKPVFKKDLKKKVVKKKVEEKKEEEKKQQVE